ncbi:MAG: ketopantoate reductase family protein [Candidatus Geothermincolia bacterium]
MRFLVMGAGSIGSVVGGLLHLGGYDVYLLGKGPHIEAVEGGGLELSGIWGDFRATDIRAGDSVEKMLDEGFRPDWTLLSVKSYDTADAMADLLPALEGQSGVISLQNGLGNLEAIEAAAPGLAVGGRVIFGATTLAPGKVAVTVSADDVLIGPGSAGVDGVVEAFRASHIPCRFEQQILSYIWDKVLYNACLNALATILRTDYGTLWDDSATRSVMRRLVDEFYRVAEEEGVVLVSPGPEEYIARFASDLLPPTRKHRSSMQEDIEQGRRTEIDALNGAIARIASARGIDAPANSMLTRMIEFLQRGTVEPD